MHSKFANIQPLNRSYFLAVKPIIFSNLSFTVSQCILHAYILISQKFPNYKIPTFQSFVHV